VHRQAADIIKQTKAIGCRRTAESGHVSFATKQPQFRFVASEPAPCRNERMQRSLPSRNCFGEGTMLHVGPILVGLLGSILLIWTLFFALSLPH
jgi:hypothetical protein